MPSLLSLVPPTPLEYFRSLVAEDASLSVVEAAASIGQDEYPHLDTQAVLAEVDAMGDKLRRRMPVDASALHRLRMLNHYFFQELGFAGNVNDYYDPANSYLHRVLATRRGIPITLAVIYVELARHIGLDAAGVSFPGHFLVKLRLHGIEQQGAVIIDPFDGRSLSRDELDERAGPYRRQHGLVGDFEVPLGLFLQAASSRDVVARILRNLKEIHRAAADWPLALAVMHRLVILLPEAWEERRDRGLARATLGQTDTAASDIAAYLEHCPEAPDHETLSRQVDEIRRSRRPRRH